MEKKEGNNLALGILGAFIGGMVATLPWILCYVYMNMMYSVFTIIVAVGALKGYEIMKGKLDKKVPFIIAIVSFICITIATLVIIPNLLMIQEFGSTSFEAFKLLYNIPEFKEAIMQDYVYTVLFTIIGVGGVFVTVKKQIQEGATKINLSAGANMPSQDEINDVKKIFEDRHAMDKDHTINKKEFNDLIKGKESVFANLKGRGIILSKKDGYYYSIENELHPGKRALKIVGITILVTLALVFLIAILATI